MSEKLTAAKANEIASRSDKFVHRIADSHEKIASLVDEVIGGWPSDAASLKFYHGEKREMQFSSNCYNTDWWTNILTQEEYYLQKLGIDNRDELRSDIDLTLMNLSNCINRVKRIGRIGLTK